MLDVTAKILKARAEVAEVRLSLAIERLVKADKAMRRVKHSGLAIVVDRPKGFVQEGKGADGTKWSRTYLVNYGYFDGTNGGDGEALDVYLGPDQKAPDSYWILQNKPDGTFDEFKVMLGFRTELEARAMYLAHTPPEFLGSVATVPVDAIRALLGVEPGQIAKALHSIARTTEELFRAAHEPPYVPAIIKDGVPDRVCRVLKTAGDPEPQEQRTVLGVVLVPDDVDSQGDTYTADEVRKTAHLYMTDYRNIGLQHKALVNRVVKLVESYIAPVDFTLAGTAVREGTWLMKVRIDDDTLWKKVKMSELTGFSIAGFATKTPI